MRFAFAMVAALLAVHALDAADESRFMACGAISSPEERLACFDAAYEKATDSKTVRQPEEPVQPLLDEKPLVEPVAAEPAAPPQDPSPVSGPTAAGTAAARPPSAAPPQPSAPAPEPTAAGAAAAAAAPTSGVAKSDAEFGLRERPEEREPESLRSSITRVNRDPYDRLEFHLENGQVWKQIETRRFSVPRENPVAIVRPGALGSYRLYLENESRWTRVKRTR